MSTESFIDHLELLGKQNRGALAVLRRSSGFPPGAYPPAFPYVERYVARDSSPKDGRRLALYVVAALYARHPKVDGQSFATAWGELARRPNRGDGIEKRFIALLGADAENLSDYLRQAVSLLAAEAIGLDYAALLRDLSLWLDSRLDPEIRDSIRQRWARDFYRALSLLAADDIQDATH